MFRVHRPAFSLPLFMCWAGARDHGDGCRVRTGGSSGGSPPAEARKRANDVTDGSDVNDARPVAP